MATKSNTISIAHARAIAIGHAGLNNARADRNSSASPQGMMQCVRRLGLVQIDSVNVLARAHYMPLFSRLGGYDRPAFEEMAWGRRAKLFEYWAHEASLLPLEYFPLLEWRKQDIHSGAQWPRIAAFLNAQKKMVQRALDEIRDRGPLAASALSMGERGAGGWWGWSESKRILEYLFAGGALGIFTRQNNFERVYGMPEQVYPARVLAQKPPTRADAQKQLLLLALQNMGVAHEADLIDYVRMPLRESRQRLEELHDAKAIIRVSVDGWRGPTYALPNIKPPRVTSQGRLLSPFDNAIFFRARTERLFGTRIRLEIYTPVHKRVHGYYVLPFLEGSAITARVDLKADRKNGVLHVLSTHAEPERTAQTPALLAQELVRLAAWQGLDHINIAQHGALARDLKRTVKQLL